MRTNLPITNHEIQLDGRHAIVSTTDTKGRINYVNPYFLEISGFELDELIGKAHNIVRHPDMPEEAFADMWSCLQAGIPWTGLVKNRCKNGDHYWVQANVTPVREKGEVVGYMSVRNRPDRAQVEAAEQAYRQFKEGRAQGLRIRHGGIEHVGIRGLIERSQRIGLTPRLMAALSALALMFLGLMVAGQALPAAALPAVVLVSGGLGLLGSLLLGWWLMRSFVRPLQHAIGQAYELAGGDLAGHEGMVQASGELAQLLAALRQIGVNLHTIVNDVRSDVNDIGLVTREIANGNVHLSSRTEDQAASLEETAASLEQFGANVKQTTESLGNVDRLSSQASSTADHGNRIIGEVGATMGEIHQASSRIADIIGLIDGISFQTNILALNAAVEAARAGEQGRGFAVVAGEVRALAGRSAEAAREIKALIDDSRGRIEAGNALVQKAVESIGEIRKAVAHVAAIVSEASLAAQEQDQGVQQINAAVARLDEVTQQNAALVEQTSGASEGLASRAKQLEQALQVFKLAA